MIREYRTISDVSGSLLTVEHIQGVACGALGEVLLANGDIRLGQVLEVDGARARISLFGDPIGISPADSKVRFPGYGTELPLSEDLLGRAFDCLGNPIDGGPAVLPASYAAISGRPINPLARRASAATIHTGLPAVDEPSPLRVGEARTILSAPGQSPASLAANIARTAKLSGEDGELTIIVAAIGLSFEETERLTQAFRHGGLTPRTAIFASRPDDPAILRLATPYAAVTAAEYFAFEKERQVLLFFLDWAHYADAYAEAMNTVSNAKWEPPGCSPYPPNHPYADLSTDERIGCRTGREGSITRLSILTEDAEDRWE